MAFIPTICGNKSNITLPTGSCSGITFEGVEDTTVNQGEGIDLMDGVTAYDEDGNEIPVTVSPTEIAKCDVGEHTVEYKAIGKGGNLKPYLPCGKGKLTVADCGISVETTERVITITQADPPTISGVETLTISVGTLVDLMEGVSAVDDNGNTVEVEFLGGAVDDVAESDDIATFETDLDVPLKSLKLTLEPQQPCTPWIGTDHDTTPYLHRAMPSQSNDYNRESGVIVGGTVGWNQLVQNGNFESTSSWLRGGTVSDFTVSGNVATIVGSGYSRVYQKIEPELTSGHKYFATCDFFSVDSDNGIRIMVADSGTANPVASKYSTATANTWKTLSAIFDPQYNGTKYLTVGEAGGNASTLKLRNVMFIDLTAMFNPTIADYVYSLEQATAGSGISWLKSYGFLTEDYYPYSQPTLQSVQATAHKTYDGDGNVIGNYALDSSLTLRGIPKLDASNNLYYDGDTYASDGTVTRKYKSIVLDGTNVRLSGTFGSVANGYAVYRSIGDMSSNARANHNLISDRFTFSYNGIDYMPLMSFVGQSGATSTVSFILPSSITSLDEANAWFTSNPTTIYYELATPTTETATAYTNPQIVDPDGTEEYVTANYVPVGHDSTYSLVCPISGYDEVEAWHAGCTVTDNSTDFIELPYPIENGETYGFSTLYPSAGDSHVMFYDENKTYVDWWTTTSHYPNESQKTNTYNKTIKYVKLHPTSDSYTKTHYVGVRNISKGEEYNFATYTADLGQTVYGGTVDLVSGEVVVDRAMVDLGTLTYTRTQYNSLFYYFRAVFPSIAYGTSGQMANMICSNYETVITGTGNLERTGTITNFATNNLVLVRDDRYTDIQSFTSAVNGVQLVYELATPQTIQLTPQVIEALKGVNNVWSEDATHVRVIFTKSLTEETQFNVEGLFSASYRAEDECGNETIITRLINVGGVSEEALENENGIALQTEDGEVLIYVAPTEPVNDLVGSAYVGISEVH